MSASDQRIFKAACCAVVLGMVLAGCASDPAARNAEVPKRGGTFVEGVVRPASLDPALAATVSERVVVDQLYDGLTTWNPRTKAPEPALARSWESSPDRKQWTFHLRDAQAGNGSRVVAGDVKQSLQRVTRKSQGSPSTDLLAPITGFKEFSTNDSVSDLAGIVAVDDKTVRISSDQPFAELPRLLGNPVFGVVCHNADGTPVSTGPMTIDSAADPNTLRLKKAPSSNAYLDRVDVRYYPDVAAAYSAFERSEVQWAPVPTDKADDAAQRFGDHLFGPSLRTLFLAINVTNPKFADIKFREAIVRAIDRQEVVSKLGIGRSTLLNGVVPDGVPGAQNGGCGSRCSYDQNVARDLLKQVFPNSPPPPITFDIAAGAPFTDTAVHEIVDDLARVGITASVRTTPADQYSAKTVAPDREMFQASWSAAYPSADAYVTPLFSSSSVSNVSGFKDAKVDADIAKAQTKESASVRDRTFQDAERFVMAQLPIVPIAQFPVTSVVASVVRGIDPLPTGNFDVSRAWMESASG